MHSACKSPDCELFILSQLSQPPRLLSGGGLRGWESAKVHDCLIVARLIGGQTRKACPFCTPRQYKRCLHWLHLALRRPQTIWQCAESGGGIAAERVGLQRHRRLEEPRQCPTGVAPRRYHHTKSQARTGLGRLGARGSDTRVPRTDGRSDPAIASRSTPYGGGYSCVGSSPRVVG